MLTTDLILDSPEKFAPSELKNVLMTKFPDAITHSTSDRLPDLYVVYSQEIWDWLQQYYLFSNQITTFTGIGDWEGQTGIEIPFAG